MATNPLLPLYGPLYGSTYFGTILTTAFYGVTCMQVFFYYVNYEKDPGHIKLFVAMIWILNTVQEALAVAAMYKYMMAGLSNPTGVLSTSPELILQVIPTNMVAILTQGYLVYRIYIFSGKRMIAPIIWFTLALVQFIPTMIYLAKSLYISDGLQSVDLTVLGKNPLVFLATLGLSVAAGEDVLIAICMSILLFRERLVSNVERTTHILQRLTIFAVNTGTWTATFALLSVLFMHFLSFPLSFIYATFFIPLCPIYCNTLLGNLNARAFISGQPSGYFSATSVSMTDTAKPNEHRTGTNSVFSPKEVIWKTTEVVTFDC